MQVPIFGTPDRKGDELWSAVAIGRPSIAQNRPGLYAGRWQRPCPCPLPRAERARGGIIVHQGTFEIAGVEQLELTFEEETAPRCGSCGAPIAAGDLCESCEQAFSSVLAHSAAPTAAASGDGLAKGDPYARNSAFAAEFAASFPGTPDGESASSDAATSVTGAVAKPAVAETAVREPEPAIAAIPDHGNRAAVLTVAAVAIVAVVGLPIGARWLTNQTKTRAVDQPSAQAASAAEKSSPAAHHVKPAAARPEPVASGDNDPTPLAPAAAPARAQALVSVRPPRPAKTAKPDRPATLSPEPVAPPVASSALLTALAPVAPPAPPTMPAAEPAPQVAVGAPVGRLFESTEVDEAPRVATRVDPQLPGDVALRSNDVVVLRILVSQTGHPFRVNVLRRSRLGPSIDDAVIAAVRHWTFAAARKRGEAVSCWYNFAVSLKSN